MAGRTHRARTLPVDDERCGWLETIPRNEEATPLAGDLDVDCLVIGSGFTGLAAARRLAEQQPEWQIAVVDAQRVGEGASGRSSGFVVDLTQYVAVMPLDEGERFLRLQRAGIAQLHNLVQAHDIDCAWDNRGWFHAAASDEGLRSLEGRRDWLTDRGDAFEWFDAAGMKTVTGSDFYHAGLRLTGSVLVQSGALVRGLARHLPPNVRMFENTPVTAVAEGPPHEIQTTNGTITAGAVVVALNAYMPCLDFLRNRVFPLSTFGSLSRPLTTAEQEALGGEREWGLLAQEPMGSSVRRTHDQRILIRNSIHYDPSIRTDEPKLRARIGALHRRALAARFPDLADLPLPYMWSGPMGLTGNQNLFFGPLGNQIVGVAGYRGAGIALGTACGQLAADLLMETPSSLLDDVQALPGPCWIPPQPFLGIGIQWRVRQMNRSAGPVA